MADAKQQRHDDKQHHHHRHVSLHFNMLLAVAQFPCLLTVARLAARGQGGPALAVGALAFFNVLYYLSYSAHGLTGFLSRRWPDLFRRLEIVRLAVLAWTIFRMLQVVRLNTLYAGAELITVALLALSANWAARRYWQVGVRTFTLLMLAAVFLEWNLLLMLVEQVRRAT